MSAEKRSALMARIRGRDTGPERQLAALMRRWRLKWESHCGDIPGRPDFVFRRRRVAVFIDGDFWHGWRFPAWEHKLDPFWAAKIAANRARDRRNHARARRMGWTVVRVWEHELGRDSAAVAARVAAALGIRTGSLKRKRGPGISREQH